jgi:uncharacterized protein (TIGR02466 family)
VYRRGVVNHLFTTPVAHVRLQPAREDLDELCAYLLTLRPATSGLQRSNRGGWHSEGNLFGKEHREFPWLRETVVQGILDFAGSALGFTGDFLFELTGWAVVNRAGDYNVPHNHNPNVISGAFYVQVPDAMQAGEIVFLDPRLNLNASVTRTMQEREQLPPWNKTSISHLPHLGDLILFPSWLMHYVNAFTAPDADAERIVISFNAAV